MTDLQFWNDTRIHEALNLMSENITETSFSGISTDSRSVREGEVFVALIGGNFDGHDFVLSAVEQGAGGVVVSCSVNIEEGRIPVYHVEDTLEALGNLARYRRRELDITVVAITGSSGKTGTKDLTQAAIEPCYESHCTVGNQNNRIGVPLTLLSAPENTQVVVLEIGTSEPGEIEVLTQIAEPHIGVVTTVSESHTEKLGSLDGVMKEKMELFRGLSAGATALVGGDPQILSTKAKEVIKNTLVIGTGSHTDVSYRPSQIKMEESGCCNFSWRGERIALQVPGMHSVQNALMALAISDLLDVPVSTAAEGISSVRASEMRMEMMEMGGITLILDCYNANPQSVKSALDLLAVIKPGRPKIAFLGSMLELGSNSDQLHRRVLSQAMLLDVDLVVATGLFSLESSVEKTKKNTKSPRLVSVLDPQKAYEKVRDQIRGDEVLLLKASRGVNLEKLIPFFEADFGTKGTSVDGGES
ncbi:MAG TPA: UDP-N-acetylmuramoyl-tripeptide--D-alanyl-D-alanine ligase [Gemmatimonadetes bacterium]|nr:UDP-N-acetylmuramoyl-tripeptide--D-alanyl-D-alanine ligase [Gemmatimonadota bacterium]